MAVPYRDTDYPNPAPGSYLARVLGALENIARMLNRLESMTEVHHLEFHSEIEELRRELHLRAGGAPEPHRGMAGDVDDALDAVLGVWRGTMGERHPVNPQDIDFHGPDVDRLRDVIVEETRRIVNDEPVTDEMMEAPVEVPEPPDDTPHVVGSI